jgi:hypothetical protein
VRTRLRLRGVVDALVSAQTLVRRADALSRSRGCACVRADARASARTHGRVRAYAPCFTPGNFKKDATVRLSHGRPRGHRPIVRPIVRPSVRLKTSA